MNETLIFLACDENPDIVHQLIPAGAAWVGEIVNENGETIHIAARQPAVMAAYKEIESNPDKYYSLTSNLIGMALYSLCQSGWGQD